MRLLSHVAARPLLCVHACNNQYLAPSEDYSFVHLTQRLAPVEPTRGELH